MDSFAANDSSTDMQPIEASSSPMALQSGLHEGGGGAMQSSQVSSTSTDKETSGVLPSYSSPQFGTSVDAQPYCQSLHQLTSGWSGQSIYTSSPVTGDVLEFCVKPGLPLARNPLIDALSSPLHCPMKLIRVQRDSARPSSGSSLSAPHEESDSDDRFPTQSTHSEVEDVINRSEATLQCAYSSTSRPLVKGVSFQSSRLYHLKIQFLQTKLDHRMSELIF